MHRRIFTFLLIFIIFLAITSSAVAQSSLSFQVPKESIDAYWNSDGTLSLTYVINFVNNPSGAVIDYVDMGLPNNNYSDGNITASVDGQAITNITSSDYQGLGCCGVAIGLGAYSINPGASGTLQVQVEQIAGVLQTDSTDSSYASAVFDNSYFDSSYVTGSTDMIVTFHLPPGVTSTEPRYHASPDNFPSQPVTALDSQGNVIYVWENKSANAYTQYKFGASFPKSVVPASAIVSSNPFAGIGNFIGMISGAILPILCIGGFIAIVVAGLSADSRRRLAYLPPKISIEGHGIKRGLTAVEAAILLEQPLDKVMTMILFSTIKKNAAEVVTRDPLEIKATEPQPETLQPYEKDFLAAFQKKGVDRQKGLQDMVVALVKNVSEKMKGFSRAETVAYYNNITKQAWAQVEAADTPEVKSQKYEEVMDWTMLDRNYDGRTQDVFRNMPVFVPIWWGRFDPGFGKSGAPSVTPASVGHAASVPGNTFAGSITNGVQTFSSKVVGSINDFTSKVTSATNPAPKTTSSSGRSGGGFGGSGGHGCACACACACAGCACACAGGGR